jgi:hypothetical protein
LLEQNKPAFKAAYSGEHSLTTARLSPTALIEVRV